FSLVILDHLREIFGYDIYTPTEEEVKRMVTEISDYHERITNLQYMPTEEEIIFLTRNIPLQIHGEASEDLEVSNYKNLPRIETNYIRGGVCLVIGEGIAQKASKIKRYVSELRKKGFKLSAWDFLDDFIELHKKRDLGKTDDSPTYIKDLVAGRPVFGHPSKSGSFRFRYGRGRVSGFSAASLHPATMAITDGFIATGTQLKLEKPIKGCAVSVCDFIEGPIVKLFNGNVKKLKTKEDAKKIYNDVEEIIYLGDILLSFGDLANRNHDLIKQGYVEEWWNLELKEKDIGFAKTVDCFNVPLEEAMIISQKYDIPLHPKNIFYWNEISKEEFLGLIDWLGHSRVCKKLILPYNYSEKEKFKLGKRALELLGVEHEVIIENIVLTLENTKKIFLNLGINLDILKEEEVFLKDLLKTKNFFNQDDKTVLEIINLNSEFKIKDKSGDFIGARMGRPEKAKLRKLIGSPNSLFPVGTEGGRFRSVQEACERKFVRSTFPINYCENCKKETIYSSCEDCGDVSRKMYFCPECQNKSQEICQIHNRAVPYSNQSIDINHYFEKARNKLGLSKEEMPLLVKGIRGTSSSSHKVEHLSKGILRALHNLQVNKDGTIRFDATELPLVSFKPKEIFTSIEKLKRLGYDKDIFGKELESDEQIVGLMPHDIILPSSPDSGDERADDVFIRVCNFIDDLFVRFYRLKPFYNVKKREDLIGQLGVCMAPHNCAGVACRIIGFSNTLGLFASPFMHAAVRRDCDGDEIAVML
ncbi:MAG: DNA polymerase II large subunit, partial [Nanoarchaeota archaeon]